MNKLFFLVCLCMPSLSHAICSVTSSTLNFGIYNPVQNQDSNVSADIVLNCDTTTSLSIKIGTGNSGNFMERHAVNSNTSEYLAYNLYLDSGNMSIWGDGTNGTGFKNETVTTSGKNSHIYGFAPKLQTVSPGFYSDSLMIELSF